MARRPLDAVVLAAGEGTRMRSATPKVLHPLCGRPMLLHVLDALAGLPLRRVVVVVGRHASAVAAALDGAPDGGAEVVLAEQPVPRGTGDACVCGLRALPGADDADVLVLPGDTPRLRPGTLAALVAHHDRGGAAATLLTARLADPSGYGRVVRDDAGRVDRVVEHRDAGPDELAVDEVNTSIYCFRRPLLEPALARVTPDNAQGEHYLTDVVALLRGDGEVVDAVVAADADETAGVNDRVQLAAAEAAVRARVNEEWMRAGVTMTDPSATYVDVGVTLAPDVVLLPGVVLQGRTVVGAGSVLGPNVRLTDTTVGERATVQQAVAREARIGDDVTVGPFAHLRPGTRLAAGAHVGEFVGLKNADVRPGAKVPHLAYVGDAEVGEDANVGAGTITANYDGRRKHRTVIGAHARIGSNTVLVAPVEVGEGAYTGAGAVVARDVPPGALARGVPAVNVEGWVAARDERERDAGAAGREDGPAR